MAAVARAGAATEALPQRVAAVWGLVADRVVAAV